MARLGRPHLATLLYRRISLCYTHCVRRPRQDDQDLLKPLRGALRFTSFSVLRKEDGRQLKDVVYCGRARDIDVRHARLGGHHSEKIREESERGLRGVLGDKEGKRVNGLDIGMIGIIGITSTAYLA